MTSPDWIGVWFDEVERSGENTSILFGRTRPGGVEPGGSRVIEPEWVRMPHQRFDGIGAFAEVLERTGVWPNAVLPEGRMGPSPGVWRSARALRGHVSRFVPQEEARRWKGFDPTWVPVSGRSDLATPRDVAWRSLDEDQSAALEAAARDLDVSLNTFLLGSLHEAAGAILEPAGRAVWMIPVNLRGGVRREEPRSNHAAFIDLELADGLAPREIHERLKALLERGGPWGSWFAMSLSRWLGRGYVRRTIARGSTQSSRVGAFSNLGEWEQPGRADAGAWVFAPPVTRFQPVGAGVLKWNGRWALAVQAHPGFGPGSRVAAGLLEGWLARALRGG